MHVRKWEVLCLFLKIIWILTLRKHYQKCILIADWEIPYPLNHWTKTKISQKTTTISSECHNQRVQPSSGTKRKGSKYETTKGGFTRRRSARRLWHAKRCIIRHFYISIGSDLNSIVYFWICIQCLAISILYVSFLFYMLWFVLNIRLFLLYNFRLYCTFSYLHCIFLDLYLISGPFYSILLHYYCIFWDLYLISGHFYCICFVSILYSLICIQYPFIFIA